MLNYTFRPTGIFNLAVYITNLKIYLGYIIVANNEIGLEIDVDKTKYVVMSGD